LFQNIKVQLFLQINSSIKYRNHYDVFKGILFT
jgi:hypothetical protein